MLGFFELHLKDKGRGAPMALASFTTLPPEDLMAFKPGKRPAKVHSLAEYAVKRGNELKKQSLARKEIDASLAAALSPAECEWINPQDTAGKPAEAPTAEIGIYQKKLIRK